jgi:hypothetical protein
MRDPSFEEKVFIVITGALGIVKKKNEKQNSSKGNLIKLE